MLKPEKLAQTADLDKLQQFVTDTVLPLPPLVLPNDLPGWVIQSLTGKYNSSWARPAVVVNGTIRYDETTAAKDYVPLGDYNRWTQLGVGYVREFIEEMEQLGFTPRRARFLKLAAGVTTPMVRSAPTWCYCCHLTVPIRTPGGNCTMASITGELVNLVADGSAWVTSNRCAHLMSNAGDSDSILLVMDVWDRLAKTQHHHFGDGWKHRF
jgi:hypothetical protein